MKIVEKILAKRCRNIAAIDDVQSALCWVMAQLMNLYFNEDTTRIISKTEEDVHVLRRS